MKFLIGIFLCVVAVQCMASNLLVEKRGCSDISGRYDFWGEWIHFERSGDISDVAKDRRIENSRPRFDQIALGVFAQRVIEPKIAVVSQGELTGLFSVDFVGMGMDPNGRDKLLKLPVQLSVVCIDGKWQKESMFQGGGENVPSEVVRKIFLHQDNNGDLLAEGTEITTKGWIFKSRFSHAWVAKFRKQ